MLVQGQTIELTVEKPAAGGRMIARHDGQVVLVAGAVPGERVAARVEKTDRRLAFADVVRIVDPSPDRRDGLPDPLCGGCVYSHIAYDRQLALKSDIVRDAFQRIGRITLQSTIDVAPSPERGHRMRARFHVADGRVGFYREGTHTLCDPAPTGQLSDESLAAVHRVVETLDATGAKTSSVELSENLAASERALSISLDQCSAKVRRELPRIVEGGSVRGVVVRDGQGQRAVAGHPSVADPLGVLTSGRVSTGSLARRPESFFQANRFLVPSLVTAVLDEVAGDRVIDLYAGVGLFSVALASTSPREIVAVEGDHASGADLQQNAGSLADSITLSLESVEDYLRGSRFTPSTAIVDPPRTGISPEALGGLVRRGADRIVYVSCDPATMARDARKLVDAGYALQSMRAFDLFPNTAHVESLGVFDRA